MEWASFILEIEGQGTKEQKKEMVAIGSNDANYYYFAQTVFGYGSNVQGIETTATSDPQTDAFVIHSPILTSSKWWPSNACVCHSHSYSNIKQMVTWWIE